MSWTTISHITHKAFRFLNWITRQNNNGCSMMRLHKIYCLQPNLRHMSERKWFQCLNEDCESCTEGIKIRGRYLQHGKPPTCADCGSPYQEVVQAATSGRGILPLWLMWNQLLCSMFNCVFKPIYSLIDIILLLNAAYQVMTDVLEHPNCRTQTNLKQTCDNEHNKVIEYSIWLIPPYNKR